MKHNEVMIGDWVRFTDPDTDETELIRVATDDIGYDSEAFWQCFSPIEITAEILGANGFIKTGYMCRCVHNRMKNRAWTAKIYIDAHYVHELQHALRLAGLDDLADNFIIEKGGTQ